MSAKALFARFLQNAPMRTGFKFSPVGMLDVGSSALGALGAIDKLRKGDFKGAAADAMFMAPLKPLAAAGGLLFTTEGLFPRSAGDGTLKGKPLSLAEDLNQLAHRS